MLLKRDISAITAPFKAAWAKYTKKRMPSRSHPIGEGVTPEQFRDALAMFGIEKPAKLAEVIGCKERQAATVWGNPQRLTAERQRKLMARIEGYIDAQQQLVSQLEDEFEWISPTYGICPEDAPEYPKIEEEYGKAARELESERGELDRLLDAADLLSGDRYRDAAERAARLEFQARALLEGFNALTDRDRLFVLRTIDGLLSRYRGSDARGIRYSLGRTRCGDTVRLRDLAELVAGGDEADYLEGTEPDTFEHAVLNEYTAGVS